MKIGVLTHPLMLNYGGILQNYALQSALHDMGHDVYTINRQYDFAYPLSLRALAGYIKRAIGNIPHNKITRWNPNIPYAKHEYEIASVNTRVFVDENIHLTRPVYDCDMSSIDKDYQFDCYVVGSDQVWVPGCIPLAFIPFTQRDGVKKITYAASAGNISWMDRKDLREQCIGLSKSFTWFSVREDSLKEKAEIVLDRKVDVVLDPTMLISAEKYKMLFSSNSISDDKIFTYILDNTSEKERIINCLSKNLGIPIITGFTIDSSKRIKDTMPRVEDWLYGMSHSSYIITDSFHGCVFAILFKKQFSVVINNSRGAERFITLLSKFNLLDRIVSTPEDLICCINKRIDYNSIGEILEKERKKSLSLLNNALIV